MQYRRNDINLVRGTFRVRGDMLEFVGVDEELVHRIEFFGDEIEAINVVNMLTGEYVESKDELLIFPAKHFITPDEKLRRAIDVDRSRARRAAGSIQGAREAARGAAPRDAHALRPRHAARSRLLQRHRELLAPPDRARSRLDAVVPARLLSRRDWLLFVDESHVTLPQVHGMYAGDRSRKEVLVEHGFRLAERARQPAAHVRRVRRARPSGRLRFGDAGHVRNRSQRRKSSR